MVYMTASTVAFKNHQFKTDISDFYIYIFLILHYAHNISNISCILQYKLQDDYQYLVAPYHLKTKKSTILEDHQK